MKTILLAVAMLVASSVYGQEVKHAPTKDVCEADVALWYSVAMDTEYNEAQTAWVADSVPNRTALAKLPYWEAIARMEEMFDCMQVDLKQNDLYKSAGDMYYSVYTDRVIRFVLRHHLKPLFQQEDEAGKR